MLRNLTPTHDIPSASVLTRMNLSLRRDEVPVIRRDAIDRV